MSFPVLKTKRLILNNLGLDDSKSLFKHFSNKDVVEYYDIEAFTNEEQGTSLVHLFQKRYNESLGIRWAIRLKENNEFVGTCGFNSWNLKTKSAIIGYDISRKHWGNGYATEALRAIIKFGYSDSLSCGDLNRIQGDTIPGNDGSEAVLKKLGFKEEGLLRQSGYWKGRFHDLKCFGLIKAEYYEI